MLGIAVLSVQAGRSASTPRIGCLAVAYPQVLEAVVCCQWVLVVRAALVEIETC